ncbi:PE family protein, partial [Mycobacterium szulgai]|nr:PE family protein [Mycobacterium szulgai]
MSFVSTSPEAIVRAASQLAGIGSTIDAANSAAASTTNLLAAAGDEVSAAIASLFGQHGAEYQALGTQMTSWHLQFVETLNNTGLMFAGAEAGNARWLGAAAADTAPLARLEAALTNAPEMLLIEPVDAAGQAWLTSPLGSIVNPVLNMPFTALTGRALVGNGAAGAAGGNGGNGGNAGWLYGHGGAGAAAT